MRRPNGWVGKRTWISSVLRYGIKGDCCERESLRKLDFLDDSIFRFKYNNGKMNDHEND